MKVYELKLWEVFINNNGYVSLVYQITKNKLHIINHNGSIYTVDWRNESSSTKYQKSNMSAKEFFLKFPKTKLFHSTELMKSYINIYKRFLAVPYEHFDKDTFNSNMSLYLYETRKSMLNNTERNKYLLII